MAPPSDPRARRSPPPVEAGPAAPRQHQQRVADLGLARGDDPVGGHAGLGGQQRQQRLAFDLLQPAEGDLVALRPVPDRSPERGREGGVVGVAAVDLHDERLAPLVDRVDDEHAGLLAGGGPEGAHGHAELGQRRLDVGQARPARTGPEHEVGGGRGHDGHQHAGGHAERCGHAEHGRPERRQRRRTSARGAASGGSGAATRSSPRPRGPRGGATGTAAADPPSAGCPTPPATIPRRAAPRRARRWRPPPRRPAGRAPGRGAGGPRRRRPPPGPGGRGRRPRSATRRRGSPAGRRRRSPPSGRTPAAAWRAGWPPPGPRRPPPAAGRRGPVVPGARRRRSRTGAGHVATGRSCPGAAR